jgi:acylglycerol lipase
MALSEVESVEGTFAARDGTMRRYLRWPARSPFMGLLLLHTFGSHAGRYGRVAGDIALSGVTIEAFDMAGHGTAAQERGNAPSWSILLDDVEDRLAALRADLPALPVGIYGHGLGGLIAADYLESERPQPDLALLMSPSLTFAAPIPSWRLALRRRFGSGGIRLVPDASALAIDEALVEDWRRDPLVVWEFAPAFIEMAQGAAKRVAAGLERIDLPLLILHGGEDPIAPARGWFDLRRPGDIDRPMSIISGLRHDVPNDRGWRERSSWHRSFMRGAGERHWPGTTPDPAQPHRYEKMPRARAVAEFEAYVAGEDERLRTFDEIVARRGGPSPGCDRESMDRFGAWLVDALEWGEPPSNPPKWVPRAGTGHELSADSIALIDGLATRIASCFRAAAPQLEWRLCTTKIDAYYHRPILEPLHLCPPIPATKVFSVAREDAPDRHWLGKIWDAWERNLEAVRARGFVDIPDDPLPLDEIVVDEYEHPRFNAQIWIPEGAEAVLGESRFVELPARLARLKGVEELVHEDREVFLIRAAPDRDLDSVRTGVVGVVRRMKQAAAAEAEAAEVDDKRS